MPSVVISPKTPEEMGESYKEPSIYPYGTRLEFEGETAEALGVDTLKAGDVVEVRALAFVKEKSEESEGDGEVEKELCLQLTEASLRKRVPDRASELYKEE